MTLIISSKIDESRAQPCISWGKFATILWFSMPEDWCRECKDNRDDTTKM